MTREEKQKVKDAVERLNALKQLIGYDKDSEIVKATQKSLDMSIKALEQQPKWIPCSERLPEDDVEVFVYLWERPSPYIAWRYDSKWETNDFTITDKEDEPLAWMPLPKPYKAESEE